MTKRSKAKSTVQIDNDRVIVTEWRFAPGAETGWHRHGYDYIVVPQTTGKLLLETESGENIADLDAGKSRVLRTALRNLASRGTVSTGCAGARSWLGPFSLARHGCLDDGAGDTRASPRHRFAGNHCGFCAQPSEAVEVDPWRTDHNLGRHGFGLQEESHS